MYSMRVAKHAHTRKLIQWSHICCIVNVFGGGECSIFRRWSWNIIRMKLHMTAISTKYVYIASMFLHRVRVLRSMKCGGWLRKGTMGYGRGDVERQMRCRLRGLYSAICMFVVCLTKMVSGQTDNITTASFHRLNFRRISYPHHIEMFATKNPQTLWLLLSYRSGVTLDMGIHDSVYLAPDAWR